MERLLTFRNKITVSPSDVNTDDAFAIKIVAVAGPANDWAVYQGPAHWPDILVADSGDKLLEGTARKLFYVMSQSGRTYRH